MEKLINSKLAIYAALSIGLFLMNTMIYVMWGDGENNYWWAFDKLNDRLVIINLLLITSFVFIDKAYKLFAIIAIVFMAIYAGYELMFILGSGIKPIHFIIIAMIYWSIILILNSIFYVAKRGCK